MPLRIRLDSDIGGDTDDLCALALLLASPEVELVGITTCADAFGRRLEFARHVLRLAGREGMPVASGGFEHTPTPQDARYWPGLEPSPPGAPGEALELLLANAASGATILAIGPYTNLALAETLRPGAFAKCPVVVMGGYTGPPEAGLPQGQGEWDYNVRSDRVAARIRLRTAGPADCAARGHRESVAAPCRPAGATGGWTAIAADGAPGGTPRGGQHHERTRGCEPRPAGGHAELPVRLAGGGGGAGGAEWVLEDLGDVPRVVEILGS